MKVYCIYFSVILFFAFSCKQEKKEKPDPTPIVDVKPTFTTATFLSLSDVHIDGGMSQTNYGSVSGTSLWTETKTKIESVVKTDQPNFMVYLGDLPGYDDATRANNTHLMLQHLRSLNINIPILYLPGNNDSLEGDYHSFTNGNGNSVLSKDASAKDPWPILHENSSTTKVKNVDFHKEFGFYSANIVTGGKTLKVIALNTVIFSSKEQKVHHRDGTVTKHPMYNSKKNSAGKYAFGDDGISQQKAAQTQMRWLELTLDSLKTNDRVLFMMHIPPGKDGWSGDPMWNEDLIYTNVNGQTKELQNAFLDEIKGIQPQVVGLLNGHTHLDGLRRLYKSHHSNSKYEMIAASISTPGISVNHNNNPAFKLFTYNTTNFDLLDFETHFAVPTNSSLTGDFKFQGDSTYTFKEAYKETDPKATIYSTLLNMDTQTIKGYMDGILGAKSNQGVYLKNESSINVHEKQ